LKKKVNEEWNKLPKVFNEEDNDFWCLSFGSGKNQELGWHVQLDWK
jgi:hypothetical protein